MRSGAAPFAGGEGSQGAEGTLCFWLNCVSQYPPRYPEGGILREEEGYRERDGFERIWLLSSAGR